MSTQHDIEKEAGALPWTAPPVQEEQVFPQPPQRPPYPKRNLWILITALLVTLVLLLSLGIIFIPRLIQPPGGQVTPTPTSTSTNITPTTAPITPTVPTTPAATPTTGPGFTPTPTQGIVWGPQACPVAVSGPAYWNAIIGTNSGERQVEGISCANIMETPSLQALVLVRHHDESATLDVYVFNNISSKPARIFLLPGLVKGDARISGYNTIMTAEVDQGSSLNKGRALPAMTPDLYREFDWFASGNKLAQVAFPGIFPDLTRYQAEADQASVNGGKDSWKNDSKQVALKLVDTFIGWKFPLMATVMSGGGSRDVDAAVRVGGDPPGVIKGRGPYVTVTLSRLEGNTHNMWVAIGVKSGADILTNVDARSLVVSPVKLEGKGESFQESIGEAYILDHLYSIIGHAHLSAVPGIGTGTSPYTSQVSYDPSFKGGPQEGVVEVHLTNTANFGPYAIVMVKVLLDPQPRVAQGPVSCPVAEQHWDSVLGIDAATGWTGTVSCANLVGDPSLQALVPVHYNDGRPGRIYVFDHITNVHPEQIFSMQTQDAKISGASTIITADVDANSSINKGKNADQMTADLYREFQWSEKAGTFVQVAFPGMYPDLTRWQAEDEQAAVIRGQDSWKLDAVKTTQHMFLLGGTAKLVKGGGSRDLTAVVNVTFPSPGSPTNIPVTQVTLNRLAGSPTGIWEIAEVGSNWLSIYTPKSGTTITSPVTVTGFGPQFEAQIGVVYILDHLYQTIQVGDNFAMAPDGSSPPSKFSLDVKYTSSFQGGAQEGIVELFHTSGAAFDTGLVMVKVLISA